MIKSLFLRRPRIHGGMIIPPPPPPLPTTITITITKTRISSLIMIVLFSVVVVDVGVGVVVDDVVPNEPFVISTIVLVDATADTVQSGKTSFPIIEEMRKTQTPWQDLRISVVVIIIKIRTLIGKIIIRIIIMSTVIMTN